MTNMRFGFFLIYWSIVEPKVPFLWPNSGEDHQVLQTNSDFRVIFQFVCIFPFFPEKGGTMPVMSVSTMHIS
jgi:hypothetical protein